MFLFWSSFYGGGPWSQNAAPKFDETCFEKLSTDRQCVNFHVFLVMEFGMGLAEPRLFAFDNLSYAAVTLWEQK